MIVDFSKIDVKETPLLILQNLDDTPIGVLKYAFNITAELCYNELSTLTFELPGYVEGRLTPNYNKVVGMRIIDLKNYGRFILSDPKETDDGIKLIKSCVAYSLEYEFTFKKLTLTAGTYNLWNPISTKDTILGMILEKMPSWKIGHVDSSLIDKYRTFDDSGDQNIYNFIKSDIQESYGCVFDFDTYNRTINVRDIMSEIGNAPILFSMENLVKEVEIEEDTESIFTSLNVYGADGVDIRSVNPMGTTSIINLDYFMTLDNFSQDIIDKYYNWKQTFKSYQRQYFNLTVEEALKTAQLLTEQAVLTKLEGELASLENIQAVIIQGIAQDLKTQTDLDEANKNINSKKNEISLQQTKIEDIKLNLDELNNKMIDINNKTRLSSFFTITEYKIIDRYLKENSITEDSFVAIEVDSFDSAGESLSVSNIIFNIENSFITMSKNEFGKEIYSISGGNIKCETSNLNITANIIRASIDYNADVSLLFTARLQNGSIDSSEFTNGCISLSGTANSLSSDLTHNNEIEGDLFFEGSNVTLNISKADLYFTRSTTEYEQRAVEWDLFDYGMELLELSAYPSYSFSVDLANFLALVEFEPFKNNLALGSRLYFKKRDGSILKPYLIGVTIPFDDLSGFSVELSDKYSYKNNEFNYADLIEDSKTAGSTIDSGKWNYNQFVNSGAETSLSKFMNSALDIAKNNIISSTGQAISWGESGLRLRKRKENTTSSYEPYEIWMNNGSIMFTTDNWNTANLAIGQMKSEDGTLLSGVIADSLIGKLLAGNSLIIESEKKNGNGVSVFRVDGSGASLHNAIFDIYNSNQVQITLNPYSGIAIGKYPLYTEDDYTINEDNANFWVDTKGNVHMKGTLEGCDGQFSGELVAASGRFKGVVQASSFQDLSGREMLTADYKFGADYLELKGLNVNNNFIVDSNGNVSINGKITMTSGNISWKNINETDSTAYKNANTAIANASSALNAANSAVSSASTAQSIARQIADGTYSGGSFINKNNIYSPTIYATQFSVIPSKVGDSVGGYSIYGYYGSSLKEMLKISYYCDNPYVYFGSGCGAYAEWNFPRTYFTEKVEFNGDVNFTGNVSGITATFG